MHESTLLLIEIGALLLGLSVLARVANRFGFSAIPLYLIVGLLLGDGGVLPIHAGEDFLEIGSELGVILLLLMLGLEYTAPELVASLKQARTAGLLDLVMNAAPGAILAFALGWGPLAALALALALIAALDPGRLIAFIDSERPSQVFGPLSSRDPAFSDMLAGISAELAAGSEAGHGLFEAVAEAIRTADTGGVRLQISHLTPRRGRDDLDCCIDLVDAAEADGLPIFDQFR